MTLGIVFFLFALWHVVLNRRGFVRHLGGVSPRVRRGKREALYALALVALVLFATLAHLHAS